MTIDFEAALEQAISNVATAAEAVASSGSIKGLIQVANVVYTYEIHY